MNLKTQVTPPSINWNKVITRSTITIAIVFVIALVLRIRMFLVILDFGIMAAFLCSFLALVMAFVSKNAKE